MEVDVTRGYGLVHLWRLGKRLCLFRTCKPAIKRHTDNRFTVPDNTVKVGYYVGSEWTDGLVM